MSDEVFEFLVIGGGMAGASIAAELAPHGSVAVLEMESQPGYHTTGRSAALFAPSYGCAAVRAITRASKAFFDAPGPAFGPHPLLTPRGVVFIAREDQSAEWAALRDELSDAPQLRALAPDEAQALCPLLRPGYAQSALLDEQAMDIDVHALHQGYIKQLRAHGGQLFTHQRVERLQHDGQAWTVGTRQQTWRGRVLVNAAGAWADELGEWAGASRIGLVPKRRTAATVAAPQGPSLADMPAIIDCAETFYLRPDAGMLLISPADETPSPPCDAQADEYDIAVCVDRIQRAFDLPIARIASQWAGLRSFVHDKAPVVGFDPQAPNFFWLAGQGGYGIQMAPALARLGAAWALGQAAPQDLLAQGLEVSEVQVQRLVVS